MQLRSVLKFAIGIAAGAMALVGVANAAPLAPASSVQIVAPRTEAAQPALVSQAEVDRLKPQQVRWGHHGHRHHWRHHGWRHHHWHHRHGGWHHRHWHHHHWRHHHRR